MRLDSEDVVTHDHNIVQRGEMRDAITVQGNSIFNLLVEEGGKTESGSRYVNRRVLATTRSCFLLWLSWVLASSSGSRILAEFSSKAT